MSNAAQGVGNAASSAYQSTASRVNQTATKIADSAGAFEQKTMAAAREAFVQVKDQPLMLVGFGLALGAAIGAAFPATELENRVMGDTADELKHEAKSLASDQLHQATDAAQHIVEDAVKTVNGSNGAMVDSGEGDSGR